MKIDRRTPPEKLPEFLRPEEVGAFLAIGRTCVYELLRSGQIRSIRFGRLIRIPKSALLDASRAGERP